MVKDKFVKIVTRKDGYKVIAMPKECHGNYLRELAPDGTVTFRPVVLPGSDKPEAE